MSQIVIGLLTVIIWLIWTTQRAIKECQNLATEETKEILLLLPKIIISPLLLVLLVGALLPLLPSHLNLFKTLTLSMHPV